MGWRHDGLRAAAYAVFGRAQLDEKYVNVNVNVREHALVAVTAIA